MKKILLVEPKFYSKFPPLGLLKLASLFRANGAKVKLVRGCNDNGFNPSEIYVTSLFTYAWKPVHEAVRYYKARYPNVKIVLGGIYASLLPEHAALSGADEVHIGIYEDAETCIPAWDLVPEWDGSIIFTSRGCSRKCTFCAVPKLEGGIRPVIKSIKPYVYPTHTKIILWDNNILATNYWRHIFDELKETNKLVDFNQGLDARLITEEVADAISKLKYRYIRLAYDSRSMKGKLEKAVEILSEAGIRKRAIVVYTLYNFKDDPEEFKEKIVDLLNLNVVCYPMRYEPLTSLKKNAFVSKRWSEEELEMVADARRVLGQAGAFPPYKGLIEKFNSAKDFHEAFRLRDPVKNKK